MQITITKRMLTDKNACEDAIADLVEFFGDSDKWTVDWTLEKQIEIMKSPLRKYIAWGYENGLFPWWSMRSANLSSANLSSADLRSANLSSANLSSANLSSANLSYATITGARICLCNSAPCTALRATLESAGWKPGADGLLEKMEKVTA